MPWHSCPSIRVVLKRKRSRTLLEYIAPIQALPLLIWWSNRVALIVQIHLQQNRTDLALKEVQAARKWAQDNLLVNIAESWVGIRLVSKGVAAMRLETS